MLATPATTLPTGPRWSYEVKWDGYRTLAMKTGSVVRLLSRNLKDATAQYPAIAKTIGALEAHDAILDGELVALDAGGRPSFQALQHRLKQQHTIAYYVFDVLEMNGESTAHRTLEARRSMLDELGLEPPLLRSDPLPGTAEQVAATVRRFGLEGVVAKRVDSRYEAGKRSAAWVKVKFANRQEFVVGGFKPAASGFDSLLVGYYDGRKLHYAGKVRAGMTPAVRADLSRRLAALIFRDCPFVNLPNSSARKSRWGEGITAEEMRQLRWTTPALVVEVSFTEWTTEGNLRHAAFAGIRDDKRARDVRRET